jgi:hypothetical protein
MRRFVLALLVIVGASGAGVAWATGLGGTDAPTRIPVPAKPFSATVEDRSGTIVTVSSATFDGEVFLFGTLGEAQVTVPFEKIKEIRFEPASDAGSLVAYAVLHAGEPVRVVVDNDVPCYGETAFGFYKIEVKSIRRITFPSP